MLKKNKETSLKTTKRVKTEDEEEEKDRVKTPSKNKKAKSKPIHLKEDKDTYDAAEDQSSNGNDEHDDDGSEVEMYNESHIKPFGFTIPRPKGSPFPDAISPDTLVFLAELAENNDRDFFHFRSKEWAAARKDFMDFVGLLSTEIHHVDPSIRVEESKKAVYRQNRDLRFSNDKSPYKRNLSASFSQTGRKFLNAGYFLSIKPNNQSLIAAGMWQPDKYRLANMRSSIIRHADLLREALSTDVIKEAFDGKYGVDILDTTDRLKVAPKDIAKDHPEIDLLRFRSFAVEKTFTDEEVVSPEFMDKVMDVVEALVPFVAVINSWV
ncbi:hypothetical protein BDF20DRAFT_818582 [Mycotypha africana]|uniref:uncharacterized protein n=1 Tax=Mycotypha africana TaxID=64632 RepID=UPI002300F29C|nr:uncharacterized protein BDF20DRAFT_818582 [Mycotypha africana]KAI8981706.1 hypothetical protein BDF20DRAFT_818582 [Mycotypha africana]